MQRRTDEKLSLALGCVEYEMHVLATALLLRRDRGNRSLPSWTLATEMIRLKTRSILEFLSGVRRAKDQITVLDFGLAVRANDGPLYGALSAYSSHLSWHRAAERLPSWGKRFKHSENLLRECAATCGEIYNQGVRLTAPRHVRRHRLLGPQLAQLGIAYRSTGESAAQHACVRSGRGP